MGLNILEIFKVYNILNGQGYGLSLRMEYPGGLPGLFGISEDCFKPFSKSNKGLEHLNQALNGCSFTEAVLMSTIQETLNLTIVQNIFLFPHGEWPTANWFAHVILFENVIGQFPLETLSRRGAIYFSQLNALEKAVACMNVNDVSHFDFCVFTAMTPTVWLTLFITVLLYGFVCRRWIKALDILWPLFGISCRFTHSRIFLAILLISMVCMTSTYQAGISSENMAFSEFPTFMDFMVKGYRIDVGSGIAPFMPLLSLYMPEVKRDWIRTHFRGRNFSDLFIGNVSFNNGSKNELSSYLKQSTQKKLLLSPTASYKYGLYDALENKVQLVEDTMYCKRFHIRKDLPFDVKPSVRVRGYLHKRISQVVNQGEAIGLLIKFRNIKSRLRKTKLNMVPLSALRDPGKTSMYSPLGIMCLFCCGLGMVLFLLKSTQVINLAEVYDILRYYAKNNIVVQWIFRISENPSSILSCSNVVNATKRLSIKCKFYFVNLVGIRTSNCVVKQF